MLIKDWVKKIGMFSHIKYDTTKIEMQS